LPFPRKINPEPPHRRKVGKDENQYQQYQQARSDKMLPGDLVCFSPDFYLHSITPFNYLFIYIMSYIYFKSIIIHPDIAGIYCFSVSIEFTWGVPYNNK